MGRAAFDFARAFRAARTRTRSFPAAGCGLVASRSAKLMSAGSMKKARIGFRV
jgi:hypothetical protein